MSGKIEGIPDGWELVRIGTPMLEEYYISMSGTICKCLIIPDGKAYAIIRKIEKPKQYRQFASAVEFEPHKNRWLLLATIDDPGAVGQCRVDTFDDDGVILCGEAFLYRELFEAGICFDNGDRFGVSCETKGRARNV